MQATQLTQSDHTIPILNTEKFCSLDWRIEHNFQKCWGAAMTCVFEPSGTIGLCCDRRGDPQLDLCEWSDPSDVLQHWGKKKHINILHNINLADCPRCTYAPHNEIFEAFVLADKTHKWFI